MRVAPKPLAVRVAPYNDPHGPPLPLPRPPLRPRPRQHGGRRHPALRQDHPGHAAALLRAPAPTTSSASSSASTWRHRATTDAEQPNVYTRAAAYLNDWRAERILAEESEPALYGYSQTYTVPGTNEVRERRGFIALGHLYDYADKVVYRHEQTFPKHKSDRLALFKATRAYCEQIYMLYSDPAFTAEKLIFGTAGARKPRPADLAITDEYDVVHRLWKLTDPTLINLLLTAMARQEAHHRRRPPPLRDLRRLHAKSAPPSSSSTLNQPARRRRPVAPGTSPRPPSPKPP